MSKTTSTKSRTTVAKEERGINRATAYRLSTSSKMDHQTGSCQEQKVEDLSRHITGSYNRAKTDNRVDNSIDNSTNIYHESAPIAKDQLEDARRQEIFNWLSALNFSNRHIDILNQREAGTGQWFLGDAVFLEWLHGKSRSLLCQGIPGAGKSTIVSIAIEYLESIFKDEAVAITYIYCNYKEQMYQTAENLMNSILWQLGMASSQAFDAIRAVHEKHEKTSTKLLRVECLQTLKDAVLAFTKVFIIVDAVDEMADSERDKFLKEIKALNGVKGVQLLIMSRPMRYLVEYFEGSLQMELRAQDTDIAAYLNEQIPHRYQLATLIQKDVVFQKEIVISITEKAQGMFLLARFHLEEVATASTRRELRERLLELPNGIDDTYNSALERIKAQGNEKADLAQAVLVWVTYSLRPLGITELQHALAVTLNKEGDTRVDRDSLIPPNLILAFCGGLVILDEKSRIFRLVHYTAQDYFSRKTPQLLDPTPDATIATACITYLSIGPDIYTRFWSDQQQYQFLLYAAQNWGKHARKALAFEQLIVLEQRITIFLGELEGVLELWTVKKFWKGYIGWQGNELDAPPGLVASIFGLYKIVKAIIEEPCSGLGEWWEDAVYYAVKQGYEDVLNLLEEKAMHMKIVVRGNKALTKAIEGNCKNTVRLLLQKGANIEAISTLGWSKKTPLYTAVEAGHECIVRLLLEKGANTEAISTLGLIKKTPLHTAVEAGHECIVRLLLEKGANTEAISTLGFIKKTPLYIAVEAGHECIVRLLLERGANTKAISTSGLLRQDRKTPLHKAVEAGYEGIVQLLLEKGANIEVGPSSGKTLLYMATEAGHQGIVRLLLEKSMYMKVDKRSEMESLLFVALKAGYEYIVQLLLEKGVDIEMRSRWGKEIALYKMAEAGHEGSVRLLLGQSADMKARLESWKGIMLYTAVVTGHEGIVQLLLEKGANIEARSEQGKTPLYMAVEAGHEGIVQLLLEKGADTEAIPTSGWNKKTPLCKAVEAGHGGIVQLLLEKGANIEARSEQGETSLYMAVEAGHEGIVQLLLEKGADTEAIPTSGWNKKTPLCKAVVAGHGGIVQLLLEKGANIEATSEGGRTPLFMAVKVGYEGIVQLLLEKGANIEAGSEQEKTPLYAAVEAGHGSIVQLLLEKGANIEARSKEEKTPLYTAAEAGHEGIVRLLLKKGAEIDAIVRGKSCLHAAAVHGHTSVVRVLLEYGASLQVCGGKLLSLAARHGRRRLVQVLLEKGVNVNTPVIGTVSDETASGTHTPLCSAIYGGHVGIVELLLEHGAHTKIGDVSPSHETTPAARDMIKDLLLARGQGRNKGKASLRQMWRRLRRG